MKPYFKTDRGALYRGDCLEVMRSLPDQSVNCGVTSPPYWRLRDYGEAGQLGLEETPEEYTEKLVEVFREFKRILRYDGTLWLNLGDSYTNNSTPGGGDPTIKSRNIGKSKYTPTIVKGLPPKNLVGIPWRVAFALQADGWYLRQDIIWHKPNPMPESVTDRCTNSHEYIFLLSKSQKYYFDHEAIQELSKYPGDNRAQRYDSKKAKEPLSIDKGSRKKTGNPTGKYKNKRSVWTVTTKPFKGDHFATFPPDLIWPCILAGCPVGGVVMDMFFGSGTTGLVAAKNGRNFIGAELSGKSCEIAVRRIEAVASQRSFEDYI